MHFLIRTPSRIHISLIDLNGSLGRIDGSLGFGLQDPYYLIRFDESQCKSGIEIDPPEMGEYFQAIYIKMQNQFNLTAKSVAVSVEHRIPQHFGYGSKTQLLLAFARGIAELHNLKLTVSDLSKLVQRGGTSGIGYQVFESGGFHIDLGHSFGSSEEKQTFVPSSISPASPALPFYRINFPDIWKIFLIHPHLKPGAANTQEIEVFQKHCPVSIRDVEQISHHILMQIIPAFIQQDLGLLADGIHFINHHGFKGIEISLQDACIQKLLTYLHMAYHYPAGMSSFGPILYVIVPVTEDLFQFKAKITYFCSTLPDSPSFEIYETIATNTGFLLDHLS